MLRENCLGNPDAFNSRFGSEAINRLVHVAPEAAMATIDRVLGNLTLDQLRGIKDGRRRHIVCALERLAFRVDTFSRAARLLRRLGAAEIEERIQFLQLYHLYLSGTQASPEERLWVLDEDCDQTPGMNAAFARRRSARCLRRAISLAWAVAKKSAASGWKGGRLILLRHERIWTAVWRCIV
jgi:hypothetical protein